MKNAAVKLIRILLSGTAFFFFWSGGALLSWVILPAVRFYYEGDPLMQARRCRAWVSGGFRLHVGYMHFCRLVHFDPRDIRRQLPDGPFVLTANHPTLIDVVLILAVYPSIYCVAKSALFKSPLVGRLLTYCDHIDAGEGDAISGAAVLHGAIARLRAGDPVLVFPEGTRSPMRGLGHFKRGAFEISCRAGVPVVPLFIACEPPGLMKGMAWYTVPTGTMRFKMAVLAEQHPAAFGGEARVMAEQVRGLFEQQMQAGRGSAGNSAAA